MKQNTFNILFYIRRGQLNKQGEGGIMVRLSINGEREMFSTKLAVNPEIWDSKSGRAIGKTAKIKELNGKLSDIQVLLKRHYYDLEQRHGYVTAEMVKNAYMGITAKAESLIPLYKEFLEDTKKMIGINRSDSTAVRNSVLTNIGLLMYFCG